MLRRVALGAVVAAALFVAAPAHAQSPTSVLGVPCSAGEGGITVCSGSQPARVPSWDGVPLDVDIYLPPDDGKPDPLIVGLHGFGVTKLGTFPGGAYPTERAQEGYAVIAYSARGQGFSCGVVVSRTAGCEQGWIHLADARYEVRDTQFLAGLLVDEGLVAPTRIGVTGSSYGGGQSLMLATLRDRMMMPDGELVPFESPAGTPMRIAAAAPYIGWSDLAYALAPTGRKLDHRANNNYGRLPGITKYSYLQGLFAVGLPGFYAPPGADPSADIQNWKAALDAGPPYDPALSERILTELRRYRSSYSVQDHLPRSERKAPAPLSIYNGFTDDIMPPDQALAYYARARKRFPKSKIGLTFEANFGHNRGSLVVDSLIADEARDRLFERYLMGDRSVAPPNKVVTTTQGCNGEPVRGPFETKTWRAQHPGVVRVSDAERQVFSSAGGSEQNATQTEPFAGGECPTVGAEDDPGAASYRGEPATGDGYTLVGSPTISARIRVNGEFPEISSRLWDVAPDGSQTMVQHSIYRPRKRGRQTYQLHPAGWHFAEGHVPKLALLGRDFPYMQAPNGEYTIAVRDLTLELPVHEKADGGQVERFRLPKR
ncbi:MAG: CocE/NonD family hydrolase [Solirubrobacterales bacterium]